MAMISPGSKTLLARLVGVACAALTAYLSFLTCLALMDVCIKYSMMRDNPTDVSSIDGVLWTQLYALPISLAFALPVATGVGLCIYLVAIKAFDHRL